MTKVQAKKEFRAYVLPTVKERYEIWGNPDWPARREAWNNFTDQLCKDGRITLRQYETWGNPF